MIGKLRIRGLPLLCFVFATVRIHHLQLQGALFLPLLMLFGSVFGIHIVGNPLFLLIVNLRVISHNCGNDFLAPFSHSDGLINQPCYSESPLLTHTKGVVFSDGSVKLGSVQDGFCANFYRPLSSFNNISG